MDLSKEIFEMLKITHGRIDRREVFRDFLAYCALELSNCTDAVHLEERREQQGHIAKSYSPQELESFMNTLRLIMAEICRNIKRGEYIDLLGPVHQQLHPKSGPIKQDFTPQSIGQLMNSIIFLNAELPDKGYFTSMEPACGSGILCLSFAGELARQGYNPCEQMVIQASDLDAQCVYMTYLQLSMYGIPAVVIRGNSISLEEYDRWYTPLYIWRKWVWREPMPFSSGRNKSDELLKIASEPRYAMARCMDMLMSQKKDTSYE